MEGVGGGLRALNCLEGTVQIAAALRHGEPL